MLSEHETLELLEQLKHGVIPGTAGFGESELVAVSHWPVLMGGGICLNMQTVAALELNRQPESIDVAPTYSGSVNFAQLTNCFQLVHHISTGVDGRHLVIAYDRYFITLLARLQVNGFDSAEDGAEKLASLTGKHTGAGGHYEFSQAIVAAIEMESAHHGRAVGLSFIPLSSDDLPLAGSWQLTLKHGGVESKLFLGVIDSTIRRASNSQPAGSDTFAVRVAVEKVGRHVTSGALVAELAWPCEITLERVERHGNYSQSSERGNSDSAACAGGGGLRNELVVPDMLQLSSSDMYLLFAEAIGKAAELTFRFETDSLVEGSARLLTEGHTYRCTSVNGLPIRQAFLTVCEGQLRLQCQD